MSRELHFNHFVLGESGGQEAVDGLIRELEFERIFGFAPGTLFDGSRTTGKPKK